MSGVPFASLACGAFEFSSLPPHSPLSQNLLLPALDVTTPPAIPQQIN